ncbi:polyprenol monophosphomannose synthase [Bdellovibrio sp. SKB1291214]|uniref:polyprenol monophosphomannose synthase n=1 Tax=Bdellovibrio sp. SKB1291214 TaxID=1732569 RepID=UPI000B515FE9|nr:polyprenol monophosphomannose synthase [Bdellovibrio sp. SKB1291214]UYL08472.1 polyprenol monophosphomannose synthase [Bdellovibrio sp. SKB1291214]
MKTLIVIPTYNEKENVQTIVPAVFAQNLGVDILVVDDNSPDGTGSIVREMQKSLPQLNLLSRPGKQGLGKAYIAGFRWGIDQGYEAIVEMDADFSHRPEDLGPLLNTLKQNDFAVGSRYVAGGRTVNWGLMRKIISRGGGIYSRLILGFPLNDWTGGFNAWKKETLIGIDLATVESNGYSFQIELKYKAMKKGFKGAESPIVFEDRRVGQSKMSLKIVLEAFWRVWLMRFK